MPAEKKCLIVVCPPLLMYPSHPEDQSKCEMVDCPTCHEKMWLSENKKHVIELAILENVERIIECYLCITNRVKLHPEILKDFKLFDITSKE